MHRLSSIPRIRGRDFEKHFFDVNIDVAPIKKKKKKERNSSSLFRNFEKNSNGSRASKQREEREKEVMRNVK